ncbi:hypothetical protein [Neobacillus soli]|uniref:hypothetical protein n=1 Tax=Neobacillus soli TaxID=220688 RepID=UPI00082401BE|nr:hypothetical protein [Neobacillus soli]
MNKLLSASFGITFFSFFLFGIGLYANIFILYGFGLTGFGLAFALFGLLNLIKPIMVAGTPKSNTGAIWFLGLSIIGIGSFAIYSSSGFWLDFPAYINKNYSRLEGIPSKIIYEEPSSRSEIEGKVFVTINNKRLSLDPPPKYSVQKMKGHRFEINYLPNTDWIISYQIEGLTTKSGK